jgi:hypothetical protein
MVSILRLDGALRNPIQPVAVETISSSWWWPRTVKALTERGVTLV